MNCEDPLEPVRAWSSVRARSTVASRTTLAGFEVRACCHNVCELAQPQRREQCHESDPRASAAM